MLFDKKICINNIKFLAKEKNIKLGELEAAANVSPGYFSRINKEENGATPSIDVLCAICSQLDISLDVLIMCDLETLSPTQEYLARLIGKLSSHTIENLISWEKNTLNDIKSILDNDLFYPLMTRTKEYDSFESRYYPVYKYTSLFDEMYNVIEDDTFTFRFGNAEYYLFSLSDGDTPSNFGYELYLVNKFKVNKICNGYEKDNSVFYDLLHKLYLNAKENAYALKLTDDIKRELDILMDLDNLPF
jgi:transcriptional regulator with XRE-family HTH domain